MKIVKKWVDCDRLKYLSHSNSFHTAHGVSHIAYFVAVMAEGHGFYALIGGVMVVFSFITVLSDDT